MRGAVKTQLRFAYFHGVIALFLTALVASNIITGSYISLTLNSVMVLINGAFAIRGFRRYRRANLAATAFGGINDAPVDAIEAEKRAASLLFDALTEQQREQFVTNGYFDVQGSDGAIYRLSVGRASNVTEYRKSYGGRLDRVRQWCGYPWVDGGLPMGDQLLGQKLLIENDAEHFRKVAYG